MAEARSEWTLGRAVSWGVTAAVLVAVGYWLGRLRDQEPETLKGFVVNPSLPPSEVVVDAPEVVPIVRDRGADMPGYLNRVVGTRRVQLLPGNQSGVHRGVRISTDQNIYVGDANVNSTSGLLIPANIGPVEVGPVSSDRGLYAVRGGATDANVSVEVRNV